MNKQDKVSLSDLNKQKKPSAKSQFKLKNPFKKQKGPARDDEGKFTAGSGGLLSGKKLNIGRMLPVIVVVALVGGIFVFRSFAATSKPPAYQYSITSCVGKKLPAEAQLTAAQKKCIDESAEAASYRMTLALVGSQNDWSYKTYTQKLAGDRASLTDSVKSLAAVGTVKFAKMTDQEYVNAVAKGTSASARAQWTKDIAAKKLSREKLAENIAALYKTSKNKVQLGAYRLNNQQFVQNIYTNLLGSKAKIGANNWWVQQLETEKWTRERAVQHMVLLGDAKNASRAKLIAYVNAKPAVKITQTAKAKQAAREKQLKSNAAAAKNNYEKSIKQHADGVAKNVKSIATLAQKSAPSEQDVKAATSLSSQATARAKQASTTNSKMKELVSKSAKLYSESSKLSKHATDISASTAETHMKAIYSYNNKATNTVNKANQQAKTVQSQLAAVQAKRKAEQARVAALNSKGAGSSEEKRITNAPTIAPSCNGVTKNSHTDKIRACQRYLGVNADGSWGPQTQEAHAKRFGIKPEHRCLFSGTCSSSGGGDSGAAKSTPLYKDATKVSCGNTMPHRYTNNGVARHGNYYSCVYKNRKNGKTQHAANALSISCPAGYRTPGFYQSNNLAGTEGFKWSGKLCKRI